MACASHGCCSAAGALGGEAVAARLAQGALCPSWELTRDGRALAREFVAQDFAAAMEWLNQVAALAEAANHHPDLHLTAYRTVRIEIYTHAAGALTDADFALAERTDAVPVRYSPKWLREHPATRAGRAPDDPGPAPADGRSSAPCSPAAAASPGPVL